MASPAPQTSEHVCLSGNDDGSNDDTIPILSRGLTFTTHFLFGILALVGCLIIQCLLATWFALLTAQVKSMNLQARMFEHVYGLSIEKAQAERDKEKKKNVVRIEITPPPGTHGLKPQIIKKEILSDQGLSLNFRTSASGVHPPVASRSPVELKVTPPTPRERIAANNPTLHVPQPFEPKPQVAEAATASGTLPMPKVSLPVSNPNWQTKSVQERKTGGSRGYAVKQVDIFTPVNGEQPAPFQALIPKNDEDHEPFLAPTPKNDERFCSFLEPAAEDPATRECHFGGFGPSVSGEQKVTMPSFPTQFHATQKPAPVFGVPSFLTPFNTTPMPVVKLPSMNSSPGSKSSAPKRQLNLQSPDLDKEQHPVVSPQKRVRKSMIKLVQSATPLQTTSSSLEPQPKINDKLVEIGAEGPPKLAVPIGMSNTNFTELVPHAVTVTHPSLSRVISNISSASVEPKTMVPMPSNSPEPQLTANDHAPAVEVAKPKMSQDATNRSSSGAGMSIPATGEHVKTNIGVDGLPKPSLFDRINDIASASARPIVPPCIEPANMDQLRYKFLDTSVLKEQPSPKPKTVQPRQKCLATSVLKETPAPKPQLELLPAIHPISAENAAREALVIAFHERESTRVELSRNYSDACVERFSHKAQEYKAKRKALASLMPSGNLSLEDEASFPHLSNKDTDPPVVTYPTMSETHRPFPLPSPPTSDDQGELGEMKKKYISELGMLTDLFPDRTDMDLISALEDVDGDLLRAVNLIMEGNESHFTEVVHKAKDVARSKAANGISAARAPDKPAFAARGGYGRGVQEDNEQHILREDPGPLRRNASKAYQVLLQATKNMEEECSDCNGKFCLNSYSPAGRRKMKSARDLYHKSRSRLMGAYASGQLPLFLAGQFPEVGGC